MSRKQTVTRRKMLDAAKKTVQKYGADNLTVRAVARELGCSTQPVYSEFGGMEELKSALAEEAKRYYRSKIDGYLAEDGRNRYEAYGMGFVRFAREERGLFRFLYLRGRECSDLPRVEDPYLGDIIAEMKNLYGMDEERARLFHGDMSVFSYGLAVAVNTDYFDLTDEEIAERLKREFYALYKYYFPERPPLV